MKKFLLSSVALLSLTAGAMAADLPSRQAPAPMISAVPIFTWTGFYVGVNAGYGFNANDDDDVFVPGVGFVGSGGDDGGFVGGAQIGYNYQIGQLVVGLEADLQYADIGGDRNDLAFNGILFDNDDSDDYFGTVRGRLGLAIDRALLYVTGGLAFSDEAGWTLGGGLEYAFTNNLTAKIEGLYVNIDRGDNDVFLLGNGFNNTSDNTEFGVIRAGLNFKF